MLEPLNISNVNSSSNWHSECCTAITQTNKAYPVWLFVKLGRCVWCWSWNPLDSTTMYSSVHWQKVTVKGLLARQLCGSWFLMMVHQRGSSVWFFFLGSQSPDSSSPVSNSKVPEIEVTVDEGMAFSRRILVEEQSWELHMVSQTSFLWLLKGPFCGKKAQLVRLNFCGFGCVISLGWKEKRIFLIIYIYVKKKFPSHLENMPLWCWTSPSACCCRWGG